MRAMLFKQLNAFRNHQHFIYEFEQKFRVVYNKFIIIFLLNLIIPIFFFFSVLFRPISKPLNEIFLSEGKNTEEIMTKLRAKGKNKSFILRKRCC